MTPPTAELLLPIQACPPCLLLLFFLLLALQLIIATGTLAFGIHMPCRR